MRKQPHLRVARWWRQDSKGSESRLGDIGQVGTTPSLKEQGRQGFQGALAQTPGFESLMGRAVSPPSFPQACPVPTHWPCLLPAGVDDKEQPGCLKTRLVFLPTAGRGAMPAVTVGPFVAIGIPRPQIMMTNSRRFGPAVAMRSRGSPGGNPPGSTLIPSLNSTSVS